MLSRLGLRSAARAVSRSIPRTRPQTQTQQRWATYQHFPGKGPTYGGSGPKYSNFRPVAKAQYIWYNHQKALLVVGAAGGGFYVFNLEKVPVTGRRRFNVIGPETEKQILADGGYEQILNEFRGKILPENHPYTQVVAKVVERLLPSTGGLAGEDWKVHVIDDNQQMNAFVMPGGKVFVFTGILPMCQDENGLAAVLGHEIAHNVAHHSAERLSNQIPVLLATTLGAMLFDVSGQLSSQVAQLLLSLPNSRTQEQEADHIGLLMMAQSCYDPSRVPALWRRMAEAEKSSPPQFLSTHPASAARAEVIQAWLPEAMEKYNQSECASTSRNAQEFKKVFTNKPAPRGIPRSIFEPQKDDDDLF